MSEVEHTVKSLPVDAELQNEINKLEAEGWELVPGIVPVIVYHLARLKKEPSQTAFGRIQIDDSKVQILRNGKLVN